MRALFVVLLAVHGAIHLFGFLRRRKLAVLPQLRASSAGRFFGVLWLAALVLLLCAAGLLMVGRDPWWLAAFAGVALSQGLVIVAWPDTKFGTVANALVAVAVLISAAHARFVHTIEGDAKALMERSPERSGHPVLEAELAGLPPPIRRWLEASGVVGGERAHTVRLRQRGKLRSGVGQPWMPVRAEQYFSVDDPGFVWKVEATTMGVLPITGRDRLVAGDGQMLIKAASLVNVANASDEKISLGAMLRFLGEIVWFPSAALSPYIVWEPLDDARAKATMRYGERTVTAEFTVDERGRVTGMTGDRYLGGGPNAKLTAWFAPCTEWRVVRGIEMPVRGNVIWRLPQGDFDYYRWEIIDVEANRPSLYSERPGRVAGASSEPISLVMSAGRSTQLRR
jgi:hypothetical protein